MSAPDFVVSNLYTETIALHRKERTAGSQRFFRNAIAFTEASVDFFVCILGMIVTSSICGALSFSALGQHSSQRIIALGAAVGLVLVFLLHRDGAYREGGGLLQIRETERTLRVSVQALCLLLAISPLLGLDITLLECLVAIALIPVLLVVEKKCLFSIAEMIQGIGRMERVIVYGAGDTGRSVVSTLLHSPRLGLLPVAVIDDDPASSAGCMLAMGYRGRSSVLVQPGPVTAGQLQALKGDLLMVTTLSLPSEKVAEVTDTARQIGMDVAVLRKPAVHDEQWSESIDIDGVLFTTSRARSNTWLYDFAKRSMDMVLSLVLLAVLAPVLVLIAILIRLDSHGPALFIQERVGRNGVLFRMFKFRSMFAGAPKYAASPTSSRDPRTTRIGRLLRRLSLDELPQLINVFVGSMSLVGPRPEMPFIVEGYCARERERLQAPPGITGLWQLSADRAFPIHRNIEYDLYYIRNRSFFMDSAILLHTLVFALCGGI
jgi:exopolysaccharide biosynthesis polyprenyl glycosylphosphotransferase